MWGACLRLTLRLCGHMAGCAVLRALCAVTRVYAHTQVINLPVVPLDQVPTQQEELVSRLASWDTTVKAVHIPVTREGRGCTKGCVCAVRVRRVSAPRECAV
jgi:hypothetical protein